MVQGISSEYVHKGHTRNSTGLTDNILFLQLTATFSLHKHRNNNLVFVRMTKFCLIHLII